VNLIKFLRGAFELNDEFAFLYLQWYFSTRVSKDQVASLEMLSNQETLDRFHKTIIAVFQKKLNSKVSPRAYFKWLEAKYGLAYKKHISKESYLEMNALLKRTLESQFQLNEAKEYLDFIKQKYESLDAFEIMRPENIQDFQNLNISKSDTADFKEELANFGSQILRDVDITSLVPATVVSNTEQSLLETELLDEVSLEASSEMLLSDALGLADSVSQTEKRPAISSMYDGIATPNTRSAIQKWRDQGNLLQKTEKCFFCEHIFSIEVLRASRHYPKVGTVLGSLIFDDIPVKFNENRIEHLDLNLLPPGICPNCLIPVPSIQTWDLGDAKEQELGLPEYLQEQALNCDFKKLKKELLGKRVDREVPFGNVYPSQEINTLTDTPIRTVVASLIVLIENQKIIRKQATSRFQRIAMQNIMQTLLNKICIDLKYLNSVIEDDWVSMRNQCLYYIEEDIDTCLNRIKDAFRDEAEGLIKSSDMNRHEKQLKKALEDEKHYYFYSVYQIIAIDIIRGQATRETEQYRELLLADKAGIATPLHIKALVKNIYNERKTLRNLFESRPGELITSKEIRWMFDS
jgi:hypothetical protein